MRFPRTTPAPRLGAALVLVGGLALGQPAGADQIWGGTRTTFTVQGHSAFVVQPPQVAIDGTKPWAWYAPVAGSQPDANNAWLFQRLIQNGFWIAGVNVGESYGSPAGRRIYSAFYDTVRAVYGLNPQACLVAQSRGGLMLYNWAADSGNAVKVSRIASIYPATDLESWPGLSIAAPAYGMTASQLLADLPNQNPVDRLAPLAQAGVQLFHLHGDADTLVPLAANSQIVYDRYTAMGGTMTLVVLAGLGHTGDPAYFTNQPMLDFLLQELGPAALPPAAVTRGAQVAELPLTAWPNPVRFARSGATLSYQLPADTPIRLSVVDASGRVVTSLATGRQAQGRHEAVWRGSARTRPGMYFAELETDYGRSVRRVLVLR